MNIYHQKQRWKFLLFIIAVIIGLSSLWYTNELVKKLSVEERNKVALWAEATKELSNNNPDQDITLISKIIIDNRTVPVIWTDSHDNILGKKNLDPEKSKNQQYLKEQLIIMKSKHEPIQIGLMSGDKNYVYYKDSILLNLLFYYPFIQLSVIILFILVSYFAFSTSRKAEQNQVWLGMSKETAHQLGTPISSLMAWLELMKLKEENNELLNEVSKDVKRLETIAERFSKVGSAPVLTPENIGLVLNNSVNYLKTRSSNKMQYITNFSEDHELFVPLNIALFEWVIENLCKNSMDAMDGNGLIEISLIDNTTHVHVDIRDTGKGLSKSKFKTIFQPGFTTKQRGWGLGLSLARRIIEDYHKGKIFVKSSEIGTGTTFRISLRKAV
ncbi:MAG: HAMP domain-containing sensor histidine kinase [Bacteroidia bacterium]|nr:HAMP domain-containing sensor histidine kinase [Bacteroidia bacterium]